MTETMKALQEYAKNFYAKTDFENSNIVGSPLGSWLLLASVAGNLDFSSNLELKLRTEACLQMTVEEAMEASHEILEHYPALNYVAQAWSNPNLTSFPSVQKWVESNTRIPYENSIPSQKEVDEWASSNTNGLIKEFPSQMDEDTMLVIANIIYSKLTWQTRFNTISTPDSMSLWNVETVLKTATTDLVDFYKNENGQIFAAFIVEASGKHRESVVLVTCLSHDMEPSKLLEIAHDLNSLEPVKPSDECVLQAANDMFKVKEVKRGTSPTLVEVAVPAWDSSSKFDLMSNSGSGYSELVQAFNEGAEQRLSAEAKQVAVAKFDKEGFEAAALTALVMARSAAPVFTTQTVYELNFAKPFVFISYADTLPVFSGHICEAKEAE